MALKKITPTHEAIEEMMDMKKSLERLIAKLSATLPQQKKRKLKKEERVLINPITGEKGYW